MQALYNFTQKVSRMVSNACRGAMASEERREEVMNYAMIVFLRMCGLGFEVSMANFKTIVHLYFISLCNGFGVADDQMLRIGTGLYFPSVTFSL